jgi:hypothetical protein
MKSDLEIAQAAKLQPIGEIASSIGLGEDDIEHYGKYKAKIHLDVLKKFEHQPQGKLIVVTAITPTPLGEGKTVATIGISQGLKKIGKRVVTTLRQPSMGPVFGIKGGAAGGGFSQVVPMEDLNLHFTGDIHAVGAGGRDVGAYHGTELPYVFNTHDAWLPTDDLDRNLGQIMGSYWTSFARSGDPNFAGAPDWPRFESGTAATLELGDTISAVDHPERRLCEALKLVTAGRQSSSGSRDG